MASKAKSARRETAPSSKNDVKLTSLIVQALTLCKSSGETQAGDHLLEALRALHPQKSAPQRKQESKAKAKRGS